MCRPVRSGAPGWAGPAGAVARLSRARASVAEDFGREGERESSRAGKQPAAAPEGRENSVVRAKELQRRTRAILEGSPSAASERLTEPEENVDLDAVWDLMVKGPNLELSFERDFIAEGVEMLNRIQA